MEINTIYNTDCINFMSNLENNYCDMVLTDIPYNSVNRKSNGLRNLDKGKADILTFDLDLFLQETYRITKNSIIIFCAIE